MKSFVFGIVGSGEISAQTASAIAATPGCSIGMVMDKNPEAASDLAGRYAARATVDMDELLNDRSIDAVYIATPHFLHADHACRAAGAHKHVFVEKPLALTDEDTTRIIRVCRENKVACATMFVNRWSDHAQQARKWVQAGAIGRIITIVYSFLQDRRSQYWSQGVSGKARPTDWRGSREKAGGGNLIMNGSHHIDLLHWITGLNVIRAQCEMGNFVQPVEVEDMMCATLRFNNNAIASLTTGTAAIGKAPALFTLFGDQGQMDVPDFWGPDIRLYTLRTDLPFAADQWHNLPADASRNTRQAMVQATVEAIREGRPVPSDGEAGAECQRVINMIYAAAATEG